MSFDSILFNSRPLASGYALRASTRQVARSTDADNIRPTWPANLSVALRANRKPLIYFSFTPSLLTGS